MKVGVLASRSRPVTGAVYNPPSAPPSPSLLIVIPWASRVTPEVVAAVERELEAAGPLETVLTQRAGHATELAAEASGAASASTSSPATAASTRWSTASATTWRSASSRRRRTSVLRGRSACRAIPSRGAGARRSEAGAARHPGSRRGHGGRARGRPAVRVRGRARRRRGARPGGRRPRAARRRRPGDFAFAVEPVRLLAARRGRLSPSCHGRRARPGRVRARRQLRSVHVRRPCAAPRRAARSFELGLDLVAPTAVGPGRLRARAAAFVGPRRRPSTVDPPRPRPGRAPDRGDAPSRSRSTARISAT